MSKRRTKSCPSDVDRWTSNGLGIVSVGEISEEHKARVAEVNRELAEQEARKQNKKQSDGKERGCR